MQHKWNDLHRYFCNISSRNELTDKGSYIFISCEWTGCSGTNGGAIYVSKSDIELTVLNCKFLSCIASHNGSGIYAQPANVVHVHHSLFFNCESKGSSGNEGGGGMWLEKVSTEVIILSTDFISCNAHDDGGGVNMWSSNSTNGNTDTFQDCRFINCKGTASEGGGILAWDNTYNVGITSTLFSKCSSHQGGGFKMTLNSHPPPEFITFCFFTQNSADENLGNDAGIRTEISKSPFLHSFTTFLSNSVACYSESAKQYQNVDNWLPLGHILLL